MRSKTKILLATGIALATIQFIQPRLNKGEQSLPTEITKLYSIPENVQAIIKYSCYDCHSNNTHYPWYSHFQPFAWMMARHIRKGKTELNFNEFGSYSSRRQISKLKGIEGSIKDGSMPLWSYTLIHNDSKLSKEQ